MRYVLMAAFVAAAVSLTANAQAAAKRPSWDDCFWLGWLRGVHTEQNEMPAWMDQCLAGAIPFGQTRYHVPKAIPHLHRARRLSR